MNPGDRPRCFISERRWWFAIVCGAVLLVTAWTRSASAGCPCGKTWPHLICHYHGQSRAPAPGDIINEDTGGVWYWMRSPEQERRVVMGLYNRYCIRCHGVDGRGVWDIPDVPDFTNLVWQTTRPDDYRTRVILEGRGAVMPAFRGTLTLEEASAMGRYLHAFVPGATVSRPDVSPSAAPSPAPRRPATATPVAPTPSPTPTTPSPFAR
jgi:Cytochrome C oxidase, cbb3-type, subunit III